MGSLINFESKKEVAKGILTNIIQNDSRYDQGADIIEILSRFFMSKTILIEENQIPYMDEPPDEIFKRIRGPQEYHKFIALQLLLSKNIEREKIIFERDNFTCQKCWLQDKHMNLLEAHHIIPLCFGGKDELKNIITLCSDCHHFAPNHKEEFDEYMKEECTGTMTILIKSINKVREEHPELFDEIKENR